MLSKNIYKKLKYLLSLIIILLTINISFTDQRVKLVAQTKAAWFEDVVDFFESVIPTPGGGGGGNPLNPDSNGSNSTGGSSSSCSSGSSSGGGVSGSNATPGNPNPTSNGSNNNSCDNNDDDDDDDDDDNPPSCTASKSNLIVSDIYFVLKSDKAVVVDDQNMGTNIEYIPTVVIRNTSCRGTNYNGQFVSTPGVGSSGSFPVRIAIDMESADPANPIYERKEQVVFIGPVAGNGMVLAELPSVTFNKYGQHVFRADVDPREDQSTLPTCTGSVGCIAETNEGDNGRVETVKTTLPSVKVGSFLWTGTVQIISSGGKKQNYWQTAYHSSAPERDISTDPNMQGSWDEVAIYWMGNKVNLDKCVGVGINNDLRNTDKWWQVTPFDDRWDERRFWAGRNSGGRYPAWPTGFASSPNSWAILPEGGSVEQQLKFADDNIFFVNSTHLHRTMDLSANRGGEHVAPGNYHEFTVTCPAYDGSTVSDTHIVRNGVVDGPMMTLIQPSIADVSVNANDTLQKLTFQIKNNGTQSITGLSYTLKIGTSTEYQIASGTNTWNPNQTIVFSPTVNWKAPNASTTVTTEICANHPGRATSTPVCDRGVIRVLKSTNPVRCDSFSANKTTNVTPGETITFTWNTNNATTVSLTDTQTGYRFNGSPDGSQGVEVTTDNTFNLVATNNLGESINCNPINIDVQTATKPDLDIQSFTVDSCDIVSGSTCPETTWRGTIRNLGIAATRTIPYKLEERVNNAWSVFRTGNINGLSAGGSTEISGSRADLPIRNNGHRWRLSVNQPSVFDESSYTTNNREVTFTFDNSGTPECSDSIDNNDPEDELVDMADPGCSSSTDDDEDLVGEPTLTITANPSIVRYNDTATIDYEITGISPVSCRLNGPGMPNSTINYPGTEAVTETLSGSHISDPLQSTQKFSIVCGATKAETTVEVIPLAQEI